MNKPWQKISSKQLHKNAFFGLREDRVIKPTGDEGTYFVVDIPPAVVIVALNDQNQICLIKEFRYPSDCWLWEVPIGSIDESDESPLAAAKKELQEETGFLAKDWQHLNDFIEIKGISDHRLHVFIAKDLVQSNHHTQASEGIVDMRFVSFEDFGKEVKDGKITDAETIFAVLTAKLFLS